MNDRRSFLAQATAITLGGLSIPQIASAAINEATASKLKLEANDVVLFQGDSITDSGRSRNNPSANNPSALGNGYAFLAAGELLNKYPAKNLSVHNRGVSGNKVFQLLERWKADAIDLKPNVLSILIGVNDFWHTLSSKYEGTSTVYKNDFIKLLDQTKKQFPNIKLIIGEPFAVPGVKAVDQQWYPVFTEYQAAAKDVAKMYDAVFIPYQRVFDNAIKIAPATYWTGDGVHTTLAGSALMAAAWMNCVK